MPEPQDVSPTPAPGFTPGHSPGETSENQSSDMPTQEQADTPQHSSAATQTPTPTRKPSRPKLDKLPPWKVVLHNDPVNTMQDVVNVILALTSLSEQAAVRRMLEAHTRGRSMLLTAHRERAELYKVQFTNRGLTVTIGPA